MGSSDPEKTSPRHGVPRRRPTRGAVTPSIVTVAQHAGVSVATVSRVVNGQMQLVRRDTAERVERALKELDYRPQRTGQALRTKESRIVAVLTPDTLNIMGAIASSVETVLRQDRRVMFLCNTHEDPSLQDDYLQEARSYMVAGTVVVGAVASPILERFVRDGEPIVFVIRKCPVGLSAPFVGTDNYRAGSEVAAYFIERGYRRCGMVHGPLFSSASREMFYGFRDRMAEAGSPLSARYVRECPSWSIEGGYRETSALLDTRPRPRAIFFAGDNMAYGAYRRCGELGLRVPEDVALFGFEDNPLNEWLAPWLSTVRVPYTEFGSAIYQVLRRIWSGDVAGPAPQLILPHELVLRASA